MWKATPWILNALLILGTGSATMTQTAPPSPPPSSGSLEQEVRQLNRSVQELVVLLRDHLAHQDVDLLLKRVEIGLQKIAPLEQELKDLRARRVADEESLNQLRIAMTMVQTLEQDGTGSTSDDTAQTARKVQLEAEVKRLRRRLSETEQRIVEVEGKLAQEQRDLQQWELLIDRRLGQR